MGKKKFLVKSIDNKRDAKFEKLLENSVVLKTKIVDAKKLHLKTDQKRTISITFLLLTFLYTFITKCILKNFSFDIVVIANIFLLFTALYLNITGNSIYSLHHQQKQQIISTIHHVVNLFIFGYTFCLFIEIIISQSRIRDITLLDASIKNGLTGFFSKASLAISSTYF